MLQPIPLFIHVFSMNDEKTLIPLLDNYIDFTTFKKFLLTKLLATTLLTFSCVDGNQIAT